jgi:hypothetical protein
MGHGHAIRAQRSAPLDPTADLRGGTIYDLAAAVWNVQTRGRGFIELRTRLLERYERELSASRGVER